MFCEATWPACNPPELILSLSSTIVSAHRSQWSWHSWNIPQVPWHDITFLKQSPRKKLNVELANRLWRRVMFAGWRLHPISHYKTLMSLLVSGWHFRRRTTVNHLIEKVRRLIEMAFAAALLLKCCMPKQPLPKAGSHRGCWREKHWETFFLLNSAAIFRIRFVGHATCFQVIC